MSPVVVGHPVGDAIPDPKIDRTNRNVSGFAMIKNVRPATIEIINLSSWILPLQPHPQSLNRPMVFFLYVLRIKKYCCTVINMALTTGQKAGVAILLLVIIGVVVAWQMGLFGDDDDKKAVTMDDMGPMDDLGPEDDGDGDGLEPSPMGRAPFPDDIKGLVGRYNVDSAEPTQWKDI